MAKKKSEGAASAVPGRQLQLGDRVLIKHFGGQVGKIVEYRGLLGPGGTRVYGIRVRQKPRWIYLEACEDQIELIEPAV